MEKNIKNEYVVKDLLPLDKSKIKYVFLFESPHNEEVKANCPVVGRTGRYILEKMELDKSYGSFGKYVEEQEDVAVLNVSNYPLQAISDDKREDEELNILKFLRKNHKSLLRHRCKKNNQKEEEILEGLQERLENIETDSEIKVVVCGLFAKAYFDKIYYDQGLTKFKPIYLPHPSRNGWGRLNEKQKGIFRKFVEEFARR